MVTTWRYSTVLAALWPICLCASAWAYFVASLPPRILPRTSPLPLTLMGSAIGLLLVFRTTNTYQRLAEARLLWGRAVFLCRELAQTAATALLFDQTLPEGTQRDQAHEAASQVCRYLAAWCWELNAKLTGPQSIRASALYSDEVLRTLLPDDEVRWLSSQRSRPLQLLGCMRRVLHRQYKQGNLPWHVHRKMEEDIAALDLVVGGCERLFSSPVPPTMSRHLMRCLALWLLGLPLVLAGTMAPFSVFGWVFITSYAMHIERLGGIR